ncbi:hypothetical protein [Candidatus Poriferisodalis sp.]|uniref:hypothetical protein n=1 Tax=Candidatus Poriferisodalis sp. TaxID=3101277 RepID=UPI003B021EC9
MAANEPDAMPTKRGRWEWLWFFVVILAGRSVIDSSMTLARLIAFAALFAAVALWASRDLRERLAGLLAAVAVLAVGVLSLRLLSPGWAVAPVLAVSVAAGATLIRWQGHRAPTKHGPPPIAARSSQPAMRTDVVASGRCRWCGLRPAAVLCAGRSDGGPCQSVESSAVASR